MSTIKAKIVMSFPVIVLGVLFAVGCGSSSNPSDFFTVATTITVNGIMKPEPNVPVTVAKRTRRRSFVPSSRMERAGLTVRPILTASLQWRTPLSEGVPVHGLSRGARPQLVHRLASKPYSLRYRAEHSACHVQPQSIPLRQTPHDSTLPRHRPVSQLRDRTCTLPMLCRKLRSMIKTRPR